jgi:hypothetical protein
LSVLVYVYTQYLTDSMFSSLPTFSGKRLPPQWLLPSRVAV